MSTLRMCGVSAHNQSIQTKAPKKKTCARKQGIKSLLRHSSTAPKVKVVLPRPGATTSGPALGVHENGEQKGHFHYGKRLFIRRKEEALFRVIFLLVSCSTSPSSSSHAGFFLSSTTLGTEAVDEMASMSLIRGQGPSLDADLRVPGIFRC